MIKIINLSKKYLGAPWGYKNQTIFSELNFEVKSWEKVMITWKSGCWKTSLLKIISWIDRDYSWKVIINWKNISELSEKELSQNRRNNIWFVFQFFNLFENLTVSENIWFLSKLYKVNFNSKEKVIKLMKKLNIKKLANKKINKLSWWELQRVAIARALFNNPKLLLLDETDSHLDKENTEKLYELLDSLHKKYNLTIISVNHNNDNKKFFDKVVKM